jgi:glycosyltransferase involved in cell wall biosynthesis
VAVTQVISGHARISHRAEIPQVSPAVTRCLSVVMPVFNEAATVAETVAKVRESACMKEIILVDDGSRDGTAWFLKQLATEPDIRVIHHSINLGKGAALRTGFKHATGEIVIIQDADLEYSPAEYETLITPILQNEADVVYGSRFLGSKSNNMPTVTRWANRTITRVFNQVLGLSLSDVETCYKAMRRDKLEQVLPALQENRFGIEIELSARLTKLPGIRIVERPISYSARGYEAGKKIGWRDGLRALWCIFKYC